MSSSLKRNSEDDGVHIFLLFIDSICDVLQRFSYGLFCNNARSNFRLKRSGSNISYTYKCGLTTAINVSQKKYRVSRRSLRLSLSYQPKITCIGTRHACTTKNDSVSLSLFSASCYPRAFENPHVSR